MFVYHSVHYEEVSCQKQVTAYPFVTKFPQQTKEEAITCQVEHTQFEPAMKLLIENGFDAIADFIAILLNAVMNIERTRYLGAMPYERSEQRKSYPKDSNQRLSRHGLEREPRLSHKPGTVSFSQCLSIKGLFVQSPGVFVSLRLPRHAQKIMLGISGLRLFLSHFLTSSYGQAASLLNENLHFWTGTS